jgi:acyl carrier protein
VGLDSVELVLAVEEEFGINIDDADAARLMTPRLLSDYVITHLESIGGMKGRCLSQAGFYRIRSALVRQFGARRGEVRPDSPIRNFLNRDIRKQWAQLKNAMDATRLPGLECKKSVAYPIQIVVPFAGLALLVWADAPGWALVFALFALWVFALIVTDGLGDVVPENLATVGALVPYVRVRNQEEWTREYVLQRVIQISAVQLGIPVDKIHPDSDFVKDLGL